MHLWNYPVELSKLLLALHETLGSAEVNFLMRKVGDFPVNWNSHFESLLNFRNLNQETVNFQYICWWFMCGGYGNKSHYTGFKIPSICVKCSYILDNTFGVILTVEFQFYHAIVILGNNTRRVNTNAVHSYDTTVLGQLWYQWHNKRSIDIFNIEQGPVNSCQKYKHVIANLMKSVYMIVLYLLCTEILAFW